MTFSNSKLVNYTRLVNNYNLRSQKISKITIHHCAGILSVEQIGNAFNSRRSSANYGIGSDGRVGLYVEEKNRAWTSSSAWNDQRAVTIEVSNDSKGGAWHVSDKCLEKTIELCIDICQRNGIKANQITYSGTESKLGNKNDFLTLHCYYANTACPGGYLKSKMPYIRDQIKSRLNGNSAKETKTTIYRVQIGAYKYKANAQKRLNEVKAKGYSAIVIVDSLYRVQVGAFKNKSNAEAMVTKLKKDGYTDAIIKGQHYDEQ